MAFQDVQDIIPRHFMYWLQHHKASHVKDLGGLMELSDCDVNIVPWFTMVFREVQMIL